MLKIFIDLVVLSLFFGLLSGGFIVVSKREHLLSVLLSFEFLSLFIFILLILNLEIVDLFYVFIYLTFTACEGALGLAILVMMTRTQGGDQFKTLGINLF